MAGNELDPSQHVPPRYDPTTTPRQEDAILLPSPGSPQRSANRRFWGPLPYENELQIEIEQVTLWCSVQGARTVVLDLERALPGTPPRGLVDRKKSVFLQGWRMLRRDGGREGHGRLLGASGNSNPRAGPCFWGKIKNRSYCAPTKAVSADSVRAPPPRADPRSRLVRIEPESSISPSQILDLVPSISIRRTLLETEK